MALGYFAESTDLMPATIGYSYEYASGYVPTMQDMIQLACTAAYTHDHVPGRISEPGPQDKSGNDVEEQRIVCVLQIL